MAIDQTLMLLAVSLQSLGKVLYGTFLDGISVPLFLLMSFGLTAIVFIFRAGPRPPSAGRQHLLAVNLSTALSFVSFFFALKYLSPAVVASLELGCALAAAIALAHISDGSAVRKGRAIACAGIIAGCLLLCSAEMRMLSPEEDIAATVLALVGAGVAGVTSTLSVRHAKTLATFAWTPAEVLAHRFYLTLAIAVIWILLDESSLQLPAATAVPAIMLVSAIGVLAPLLLMQVALRRTDALTVMICFAAQPLLSFLIAIPSPAYAWDVTTLLGVVIVTLFLAFDIMSQRRTAVAPALVR
jgi:drug/metabolite transporter (DMT)-like permease